VTPDALTQIIFDKQVGDIIKVRGEGNIQMNMDKLGAFTLYGDYRITSGDYLFTLKNLINKKFIIQNGGTITFNGDPFEAQIQISALYDLKASPLPIMPAITTDSATYKRRIPVQCNILLQNNLMNPDISYNISVASGYSDVQDILNAMSSDDKNKQFLSLLLMNSFFSQSDAQTINSSASFEVLSNQLNNLLSQSYSNIDLGVNYRPGDMYSANEFELALSTQLLNNRILVNVNGYSEFGQSADQTKRQTTEIAGDVSVEIKLTKQGNFRLKAFSRNNTDPLEDRGNSQGVSVYFTREFNTFKELFKKK
ncbi:MAG TPA: translocation/assembly module TamB domain-containing protein, partial [Bacteroidales bacterium]|nr:translocation/assembly module TamB domain-containing protein [Bacteroidales bacterium]